MEKLPPGLLTLLLALLIIAAGCSLFWKKKKPESFVSEVVHPDWAKNMVLYEVNIRQYTEEGSFTAFSSHLPRLQKLGTDVLWFMPVFPIGEVNRKGALGSYYSVRDFTDVNPEFGTLEEFRAVVDSAHAMGMHVLLDWVPNHSSWDNKLTTGHPEFYARDAKGNFTPPIGTDWTDVIQLDWNNKGLQDYMIEAMSFWVKLGIDGFRVDHPHNTPKEFWERARSELASIRPVLLLAEHEEPGKFMEKGFDMNYAWEMHHLMKSVARGKSNARAIRKYFEKELAVYPPDVYRLMFLTNHDENSWAGTTDSLMGNAQRALATLIFTSRGIPLLYSGQEACLDKKLKFFERDPIEWDTCDLTAFYADLIKLKKLNPALMNGESGGPMTLIKTNKGRKIFAFFREKANNRVVVFLNLSKKEVSFIPSLKDIDGRYTEYFTGQEEEFPLSFNITLNPWGYKVFIK